MYRRYEVKYCYKYTQPKHQCCQTDITVHLGTFSDYESKCLILWVFYESLWHLVWNMEGRMRVGWGEMWLDVVKRNNGLLPGYQITSRAHLIKSLWTWTDWVYDKKKEADLARQPSVQELEGLLSLQLPYSLLIHQWVNPCTKVTFSLFSILLCVPLSLLASDTGVILLVWSQYTVYILLEGKEII